MRRVIGFDDFFAAIVESAVTDEEAVSSISDVGLLILGNCVVDEGQPRAVVSAMPQGAMGAWTSGKA